MIDENREQAQALLDGTWTERYRLSQADVDACRAIFAQLVQSGDLTGNYDDSTVQAYKSSAVVTLRFDNETNPLTNHRAANLITGAAPQLGQLCRKVIAHWDTGGDRLEKLEAFYAATVDADRYRRIEDDDVPEPVRDRLFEAREALR